MINNDINSLSARTKKKVQVLLSLALFFKLDCFVFEAKRTKERQKELFGYGRSAATCKKYGVPTQYAKPNEKQRTWTLSSKHLIGEAVDIVFDGNSDPKIKKPIWSGNYKKLIELSKYCGLFNLAPKETCHFEDDGSSIESVMKKNGKLWNDTKDIKLRDLLHYTNETIRSLSK